MIFSIEFRVMIINPLFDLVYFTALFLSLTFTFIFSSKSCVCVYFDFANAENSSRFLCRTIQFHECVGTFRIHEMHQEFVKWLSYCNCWRCVCLSLNRCVCVIKCVKSEWVDVEFEFLFARCRNRSLIVVYKIGNVKISVYGNWYLNVYLCLWYQFSKENCGQ